MCLICAKDSKNRSDKYEVYFWSKYRFLDLHYLLWWWMQQFHGWFLRFWFSLIPPDVIIFDNLFVQYHHLSGWTTNGKLNHYLFFFFLIFREIWRKLSHYGEIVKCLFCFTLLSPFCTKSSVIAESRPLRSISWIFVRPSLKGLTSFSIIPSLMFSWYTNLAINLRSGRILISIFTDCISYLAEPC